MGNLTPIQVLAIIGAIFGVSATLGTAVFVFRSQINKDLIEAQDRRIISLKGEMDENDRKCHRELSELKGKVETLSSEFSDSLVNKIMTELDQRLDGRRTRIIRALAEDGIK